VLAALAVLAACGPGGDAPDEPRSRVDFELVATVGSPELREISGLETIGGPLFLVHNDEGQPDLFVLDASGSIHARFRLAGANNRDWEDIGWVDHPEGHVLAIGDIGDNMARRASVRLYFVELAESLAPSGAAPVIIEPRHVLDLRYPDGPRDSEALAYDPSSGMILLLSKRDKPPRLYGVDAGRALAAPELELEFLGVAPNFRPPTREDIRNFGKDAAWVSQPTGMDINADGTLAAVITYRSLYLFSRDPQQTWAEAFQDMPREFLGPASRDEEAIAFSDTMDAVFITTEGHPAPIYRAELPPPRN